MSRSKGTYFCGTKTVSKAAVAIWHKKTLSYWVAGSLPGVSSGDFDLTIALALASWQAVIPLSFSRATSQQTADLLVTVGTIDGPKNVLAFSGLPDGRDQQIIQKYDTSERFNTEIGLFEVAIHELGHFLGLQHTPQGSPDVMAPVYRSGLKTLQAGDISRVQALYGARQGPVDPPQSKRRFLVEIDPTTWASNIAPA